MFNLSSFILFLHSKEVLCFLFTSCSDRLYSSLRNVCVRIQKVKHSLRSVASNDDHNLPRRSSLLVGRRYHVGQLLGRGAFGEVRLGNSLVDGFCLFTMKTLFCFALMLVHVYCSLVGAGAIMHRIQYC